MISRPEQPSSPLAGEEPRRSRLSRLSVTDEWNVEQGMAVLVE
jgi:hypothetical protein